MINGSCSLEEHALCRALSSTIAFVILVVGYLQLAKMKKTTLHQGRLAGQDYKNEIQGE